MSQIMVVYWLFQKVQPTVRESLGQEKCFLGGCWCFLRSKMNQVAASIVASFDDITFTDAAVDMIKICLWHVVHKLVELLYKTDGTAETKLELVAHLDYEATTNIGIFRSRYGNKKRKVCTMEHVLYALDQLVRPTQALQYRYRQLQKHPDEVMEEARLQLRQNLEEHCTSW